MESKHIVSASSPETYHRLNSFSSTDDYLDRHRHCPLEVIFISGKFDHRTIRGRFNDGCKIIGLFFPVMCFVICGYEHCIANMFYFGAANMLNLQSIVYLCIVIVGNAIGGMLFPVFDRLGTKK